MDCSKENTKMDIFPGSKISARSLGLDTQYHKVFVAEDIVNELSLTWTLIGVLYCADVGFDSLKLKRNLVPSH